MLKLWVLNLYHLVFVHLCAMIHMLNSLVLHLLLLLFLYESEMILMLNCRVQHLPLLLFVQIPGFNCTLCTCFTSDNDPRVSSECYTCFSSDLLTCMRLSWGSLRVLHLLLFRFAHLHEMILGFPLSDTPASLPICSLTCDDPGVPSECYTCFSLTIHSPA